MVIRNIALIIAQDSDTELLNIYVKMEVLVFPKPLS